MTVLLCSFLILNFLAFAVTGYDKRLAVVNKRRISEKTLLGFVAFGGTLGSGLAMLVFRHKVSKTSYLLKYFGIVCIQVVIVYLFIKNVT